MKKILGYIILNNEEFTELNKEANEYHKDIQEHQHLLDRAIRKNEIYDKSLKTLNNDFKKLEDKYHKMAGKCGGLTKQNNKLKEESKHKDEIIANFKNDWEIHNHKKTPKEFYMRVKN